MVNEGHTTWFEVHLISLILNKINQVDNLFIVNPILYKDWGSKTERSLIQG